MDENTIENIRYKFELKKLIGDEVPSDDAMINGIRSDPWVDDLDRLSSTPNSELQEDKVNKDISFGDLYSKYNDEAKLIEDNIDLYNDLVKIEEEERKAKQIHEMEFENCKKELEKYRKADIESKARIEKLTIENENLKKSISSSYLTFKNEIEFKDKSLVEANIEITRLQMYLQNGEILKTEKCLNCENNSKKESSTYKRKRSESPERPSKQGNCKSSRSKTYETDLQSEKSKRKIEKGVGHEITKHNHGSDLPINRDVKDAVHKQISKDVKHDKGTQTSNDCVFCQSYQNSKDFREINDMFFNLLPDPLQKSFHDYERSQVISLNKLKEKFIDEYLSSIATAPSSSESTPKRQDELTEQSVPGKSTENRSSRTVSTPASSSVNRKRTEVVRRFRKGELDKKRAKYKHYAHNYVAKVPKNCYNSRQKQKDLISLFRYRKEKIPFEEKKKFGLHKDDKKLIPKELL